eukprot:Em0003g1344a
MLTLPLVPYTDYSMQYATESASALCASPPLVVGRLDSSSPFLFAPVETKAMCVMSASTAARLQAEVQKALATVSPSRRTLIAPSTRSTRGGDGQKAPRDRIDQQREELPQSGLPERPLRDQQGFLPPLPLHKRPIRENAHHHDDNDAVEEEESDRGSVPQRKLFDEARVFFRGRPGARPYPAPRPS